MKIPHIEQENSQMQIQVFVKGRVLNILVSVKLKIV